MSTPSNYFYDGQVRKFISQFIRLVSDFYVEFGKDRNGITSLQRVPVMYGDPSRQAAQIIRNNSENTINAVPAMAVYVGGLEYDRDRVLNPYVVETMQIRQREFDPVTGTYGNKQGASYSIDRLMPVPYKLTLKMDVWTSNTEQKLQLVEQIGVLFNPALEIQSTDNYIDWSSLSAVFLTDTNWDSRSVPTGGEEPISVFTYTFEIPIWISTSVKVKKMGVIQQVITNFQDLSTLESLGTQQVISVLNYGVLLNSYVAGGTPYYTLKLLKPEDIAVYNEYGVDGVIGTRRAWAPLLDEYGNFISGSTEIRLSQPNGSEIVGTVATNPADPSTLLYTPFGDTLPANTLNPINAIIDPQNVNVGSFLTNPATGTRYLLINDIGDYSNSNGALAWRGTDGQDLVAHANDIVQYNGVHWTVSFDSANENSLQYVTNLTTGIQYKWQDMQWTKSYDGMYNQGDWMLVL